MEALPGEGRFVVLRHDWPTLHWDLMLDAGASLRTWRLAAEPAAGAVVVAEPIADHRREYLDYEGPVSGGRGTVTRFAAGLYRMQSQSDAGVVGTFAGASLTGAFRLTREPDGVWSLHVG